MSWDPVKCERAQKEPIFFMDEQAHIDTKSSGDYVKFDYSVQGSKGDQTYRVTLCPSRWFCDCIDFRLRFQWCKHVYFVLLKVLEINENDSEHTTVWHKATQRALHQIVNGPPARSSLTIADERREFLRKNRKKKRSNILKSNLLQMTQLPQLAPSSSLELDRKLHDPIDANETKDIIRTCGICLMGITTVAFTCRTCQGKTHDSCMKKWDIVTATIHLQHYRVCIYCRATHE